MQTTGANSFEKTLAADAGVRFARRAGERELRQLPALRVCGAMVIGVLWGTYQPGLWRVWLAILTFAVLLAIFSWKRRYVSNFLLIGVMAGTALWTDRNRPQPSYDDIYHLASDSRQPVALRVEVASSPELRAGSKQGDRGETLQSVVDLRVLAYRSGEAWETLGSDTWSSTAGGITRCVVDGDIRQHAVGDRLEVLGYLQRIAAPTNPGSSDMRLVYARKRIFTRLQVDSVEQIKPWDKPQFSLMRCMSQIGNAGEKVIEQYVGDPSGTLISALVLGRRQAVDIEFREQLLQTGTIHMLSVSGLHMGMVAGAVTWLTMLLPWPRGWQVALILGTCCFYAALTGANPPVMRAAILVGAILIGTWLGRLPNAINSLAVAAICLLVIDPSNLLQTGTQLSFLAVAVLVLFGKPVAEMFTSHTPLDQLVRKTRTRYHNWLIDRIRNALQFVFVSFWVWIITAPLVWHAYNIISPISVLANLLLIVPLTAATLLGLFTAFSGMMLGDVAAPFGWICRQSIDLVAWVVSWCSEIPMGYFWFPSPPRWWIVVFYIVLVGAMLLPRMWISGYLLRSRFSRRGILCGWLCGWFAIAVWLATKESRVAPDINTQVTFIDVSHGTSVLIELPQGRGTWLYDAGRLGDPQWSIAPIQDVLWSRGIWQLDGLILSHADADHYNAASDLLNRFVIKKVITPPGMLAGNDSGIVDLRTRLEAFHIPVIEQALGDQLTDRNGHPWASILHPPEQRLQASDNANSLVLAFQVGARLVLLPGDLEMPGTEMMLAAATQGKSLSAIIPKDLGRPDPGGILMAPHHGSLTQDPLPVLQWMRPAEVIVSGGPRSNRPEVVSLLSPTGANVSITAALGAIRINLSKTGDYQIDHWKQSSWQNLVRESL